MNRNITNILIAGVGGQGVLLVSEILSEACLRSGYDVKKSEVHGMAQRGGSVTSHVRFGKQVHSPLIEKGQADVLVSFEELEALRWIAFLKPGGTVVVNAQRIAPMTVSSGVATYPEDVLEQLRERTSGVVVVDGIGIARNVGNPRVVNVVLLGALSKHLNIEENVWREAISGRVPPKTIDVNLKAFEAGRA
ncbi:MAG: indolepyruvate oxidoreductase subunit beta [Candidatus Latescibacterota bacterium]|nr:indolepyruvate oxidoreductase subunit beta [Candidatus Latescibacterota bacterium]OPX25439.1 MAG: indolepyruvate ferredoxin oxidoreductase subunit beta [Candidatus Latescibacteria bacterium 4484_107]RKY70775.1 MAG: indolepyruvate oxidoreductase subunit beta [Candidatus Latescibacterota bacterium]